MYPEAIGEAPKSGCTQHGTNIDRGQQPRKLAGRYGIGRCRKDRRQGVADRDLHEIETKPDSAQRRGPEVQEGDRNGNHAFADS